MNDLVLKKIASVLDDYKNYIHITTSISAEKKQKLENLINSCTKQAFDATGESAQRVFGIDNLAANEYFVLVLLRTQPLEISGIKQLQYETTKQMRQCLLALSAKEKTKLDSFVSELLDRQERRQLRRIQTTREENAVVGNFVKGNYYIYVAIAYEPVK